MTDIKVTGAEDFLALSKALKKAGRTDMRKALAKGLKDATKPLIADTKAATSRLPQSGGLAARVAKAPQTVKVLTGKTAGVKIAVGGKGGAARMADTGRVRHPVFGRPVFVTQSVDPGWFTQTLEDGAPVVRPKLIDAIEAVAAQIVREAK